MIMIKPNDKKFIKKIKDLAVTLYQNKQITKFLCRVILEECYTNEKRILSLMELVEDLTRIKGYYRTEERINNCDNAVQVWLNNNDL